MNKYYSLKYRYTPYFINAVLALITLVLSLSLPYSKDDWKDLSDPYDYLQQSKIPLFSTDFFFAHKVGNFSPRPFTVPLFYKLCNSNPDSIVQMQRVVLSLSAFFMVSAFISLLGKTSSKHFIMVAVYMLISWWNVQGWAVLLLSESLSASLVFCWLASLLFLYRNKNSWGWWAIHAVIAVLLGCSRDSWPYVLMCFYAGISLVWLALKQPAAKKYAALFALSLIVFFIQQRSASMGERHKLPVINCIAVRILNNPGYTQWFVDHGMPQAEKLQKNFAGIDAIPEAGQHRLWALCSDTAEYQPFLTWVTQKGQSVYTHFLITHPAFVLGADETPVQLARIISYNLFYIDEPRGYSAVFEYVFPLFGVTSIIVLSVFLLILFVRHRHPVTLAPIVLALFTLLNAILCYNGDALEVDRHLFLTNILVQLTGIWALTLVWDGIIWSIKMTPDK